MIAKEFTDILGIHVSVLNYQQTLNKIASWIENDKRQYICVAAVHLVMECQKDKGLLAGVNHAGLVTPDGMPLVWLSHFYGQRSVERIYGPTLMQELCKLAALKKYRIFLFGGLRGQSRQLKRKLIEKYQKLIIVGAVDTAVRPFTKSQNAEAIRQINGVHPDIVFVGLGCPWQEKWMIENRACLRAATIIGVGAAFDFLSGYKKQAPHWIQHAGFEWLFRLIQEPQRLIKRYTITNILFLVLISRQLFVDFVRNKLYK